MVGNSVPEDMVVEKLGVRTFLANEFIENPDKLDVSTYPQGTLDEAVEYILANR